MALAEALRSIDLTGTKIGCATGDCGASTVHSAGKAVSCRMLAERVESDIVAIEGLEGEAADALGRAFAEQGAFQCGFCTSGQIMQSYFLLAAASPMDDRELARALSGELCRCTGYAGIIRAIRSASAEAANMILWVGPIAKRSKSFLRCIYATRHDSSGRKCTILIGTHGPGDVSEFSSTGSVVGRPKHGEAMQLADGLAARSFVG